MTQTMGRRAGIIVLVATLVATIGSLALTGTASAQSSPAAQKKIVFHVGIPGDMVSPNPFKACCGYEYEMFFLNYDMLFNFSAKDLTPVPGLATSCDHSSDYMTWTCHIRSGVKWSDGQPLTASDIAFTYTFIVKNNLGAFSDYLPFDPTFSAPDATTLVWKSSQPTFAPETPPWIPILPEHIWSKYDGESPKDIKAVNNVPAVGSGPFHLVEWKPGQFFRMEANHSYWGGNPTIDEIVYQEYDNREAMVQALKAGQIDFADDLNPTLFNALKGTQNIGLVKGAPSYFHNLAFNFGGQGKDATNLPALHDLRVRQAIEYGIDKQGLVDKVWQGDAEVGTTITMPNSPWHWEPPASDQINYDPQKANQILDDAGYKDTNGDGIRNDPRTGDEMVLDILTINSVSGSVDEGKLIQAYLKQVGIGVKLEPVSESKAYALWADGDFDAYVWDWGGDPDPDFILSIFTTHQCLSWSDGCYSNKQYDKMYLKQKTIFDRQQRYNYVAKMQDFIYKQIPEIVTDYPNYLQAYRTDRFTGYVPMPTDGGNYLFSWGPLSYINIKPVSATATSASSGGVPGWIWLIVVAAIVVIGAIFLMARRRHEEDVA